MVRPGTERCTLEFKVAIGVLLRAAAYCPEVEVVCVEL